MKNVLFLCSQNRLRSPTAEQLFAGRPGIEVLSAGLNHGAETPVDDALVAWADIIFVMERAHRNRLRKRFGKVIRGRVVCLNIADDYEFMEPSLVTLLERLVPPHLP